MRKKLSPKIGARRALQKFARHGTSRKKAGQKYITSIGTEQTYRHTVTRFFTWLQKLGKNFKKATHKDGRRYLEFRSTEICQVSLNRDRIALEFLFKNKFKYYLTRLPEKPAEPRRYSYSQVIQLLMHVSERLQISILICLLAGLRTSELLTIARPEEQVRSDRKWRTDLFIHTSECMAYTVKGKGGLVRTVMLPIWLAAKLEKYRRPKSIQKRNYGAHLHSLYDIPGGSNFSHRFPEAARKIWGFSHGTHGLRGTYAQVRLSTLVMSGLPFETARLIVSQELGHFSPSNIRYYLPGSNFFQFLAKGSRCDLKALDMNEIMEKAEEDWSSLVDASIFQ